MGFQLPDPNAFRPLMAYMQGQSAGQEREMNAMRLQQMDRENKMLIDEPARKTADDFYANVPKILASVPRERRQSVLDGMVQNVKARGGDMRFIRPESLVLTEEQHALFDAMVQPKEPGRPVMVQGPDGPVYADPAQAIGQRAYVKPPQTAVTVNNGQPKPPTGYRYTADGQALEAIPGGPEDPRNQPPPKPAEPKYDAKSGAWVYPPDEKNPQGSTSAAPGRTKAFANLSMLAQEFVGSEEKPGPMITATTGGPMGVGGYVGQVTDYQDQKIFKSIVENMSNELRRIFRIPGEGALSDREQALYGLQLPQVTNDPQVNRQIIAMVLRRAQEATAPTGAFADGYQQPQIVPGSSAAAQGPALPQGWIIREKPQQ